MSMRYVAIAGFVLQALTIPSMAQVAEASAHGYSGGPKSSIPHSAQRQTTFNDTRAEVLVSNKHGYQGGPNTGVLHSAR